MPSLTGSTTAGELFERRDAPLAQLADEVEIIGRICQAMAVRFHRGGKLLVFGNGGACTDAQHVAVEFVHPVIMGKQALPALSLTADIASVTSVANSDGLAQVFAYQIQTLSDPSDIALGLSADGNCANVLNGLSAARACGLLTVALVGGDGGAVVRESAADHIVVARSSDPQVIKEVHVTVYHLLWELVHVFLQRPQLCATGMTP